MILVVMRHARAAPADNLLNDHQRALDGRGRLEAREVGGSLAAWGIMPDHVLCSDARRTRETWDRMEGAFGRAIPVDHIHEFYTEGVEAAPVALAEIRAETALIIGHNPDWEYLVEILSGRRIAMSPATAVILDIASIDWAHAVVQRGKWRLADVLKPL
jgi:phosphohistidine phosphatase